MVELTLKERKMNVLQWTDNNLSKMKHFCGKSCTISYETCCIDDFWLLTVKDSIRGKEVNVPIGDYVVEYDDGLFTVMNTAELEFWFNPDVEITGVDKPKVKDENCEANTNSATTEENDISWKRILEENKYQ